MYWYLVNLFHDSALCFLNHLMCSVALRKSLLSFFLFYPLRVWYVSMLYLLPRTNEPSIHITSTYRMDILKTVPVCWRIDAWRNVLLLRTAFKLALLGKMVPVYLALHVCAFSSPFCAIDKWRHLKILQIGNAPLRLGSVFPILQHSRPCWARIGACTNRCSSLWSD